MFVGLIAVAVVLLVIVAIMSSGITKSSGGVDQTKATKVLSEVSALYQSIEVYPTTTLNTDFSGLSPDSLSTNGFVKSTDIYTIVSGDVMNPNWAVGTKLVKSKSVDGVFYYIVNISTTQYIIVTTVRTSAIPLNSGIAVAIENSLAKMTATATITNPLVGDGIIILTI